MEKRFLLSLFLFLGIGIGSICHSINPTNLRFQYLTTADGLPQNTIDCIFLDSQRFMWFGTWNGLCRYDGYSFKIFQKSDSQKNIPDNFVHAICEDKSKNLWVGTAHGVVIYNLETEQFFMPDSLQAKLGKIAVTSLDCDKDGGIWVAAEKGKIFHVTTKPGSKQQFDCIEINSKTLINTDVKAVCVLKNGRVLVGTGVGPFEVIKGELHNMEFTGAVSGILNSANILCIYESENGDWWFGSDIGFFWYRQSTRQLTTYTHQPNDRNSLMNATVMAIAEETSGTILIGTLGGLNFFDPETATISGINGRLDENGTLNNEFVNSLFTDHDGDVWIGTEKGGVNKYSTFQKPFYSLRNHPDDPNSLSNNTINSILNDGNILWVGTAGGGLNRVDQTTGKIEHFIQSAQNPNGISSNFISSICLDLDKQLWVSFWGLGIGRLVSEKSKTFTNYLNQFGNPRSLVSNFVSGIVPDQRGFFLVGTIGGLDLFDPKIGSFFHFQEKFDKSVETPAVGCILKDRNDYYWIGSRKGLFRIPVRLVVPTPEKLTSDDYQFFANISGDSLSLPGNYVISLLEDHLGNIWVGTYGNGFCKAVIGPNGKIQFISYLKNNGLCNDVVYAMEEDRSGNIWISTDNGLSKFNPEKVSFQNFYTKDGLLNDQFYWTSSSSDNRGNLYFGGVNGLNYFSPEQIEYYPRLPKVVFTDFQVFNQSVKIGEKLHGNILLNRSVAETRAIELSYKDNIFSIEFSALDYFLPDKVIYAYKMEGIDQNWVTVTAARRFATYTNLSGGEYRFLVKAANSDGLWSAEPTVLRIIIDPPYWQTSWFRLLAILALILSVLGYIRYRTRYLHEQKRKLEIQVHERTLQIEEQKEKLQEQSSILLQSNNALAERRELIEGQKIELEKQNQLIVEQRDEVIELNKKVSLINQLRLRFFTNISHEFRTPLTLILDPLESLMESLKNDKQTLQTLKLINRNAQRLLHLINQLMYFRKIETGKMELRVVQGDLEAFLKEVFDSFLDLAGHNKIQYSFSSDNTPLHTWFDPEKIENIFYNLLSNAFKFTPEGGQISMKVDYCQPNETQAGLAFPFVRIIVSDSGKGISAEHLPFVFDRFYQADSTLDNRQKGSGVGLALTQELVQAMHGEISVESELGKGSTFQVSLPYHADNFADEELDPTGSVQSVNLQSKVDVITEELMLVGSAMDEPELKADKSKPLILIVEDNYDLRTFLIQSMKNDFRLLGAENGKEGLEMAKKFTPDLIISDVMMPVMDGLELCSRLKKEIHTSHIPVILLTAKAMIEHWIEGLETGADDYIPKPFNLKVLQLKIVNLIESRRKLKRMFSQGETVEPSELTSNSVDEEFLAKAYRILEKNYIEPEFSASQFASEMFVSQSLLYKKIRAITDLNITDFINSFKLKKAVELIQENKLPIADIAFNVGFNDPKYFSRIFRKFYGMSPSEFKLKK
jgi:signal transduction histidine kinase/ligand-binding sensor domain-containing protein/CheY-like chemotaxis protein/AraC-like DNA-binding protein